MIGMLIGNWQRIALYAALAALLLGVTWMHGMFTGREALYKYQGEEATRAATVAVKRAKATERVVVKYVAVQGATEVVTQTVEKEVVRYANTGSCLDLQWAGLHNDAAANRVPGSAPGPDEEGGAPTAAKALTTVTANYAACHRTADRLDALQDWVRQQQAVPLR